MKWVVVLVVSVLVAAAAGYATADAQRTWYMRLLGPDDLAPRIDAEVALSTSLGFARDADVHVSLDELVAGYAISSGDDGCLAAIVAIEGNRAISSLWLESDGARTYAPLTFDDTGGARVAQVQDCREHWREPRVRAELAGPYGAVVPASVRIVTLHGATSAVDDPSLPRRARSAAATVAELGPPALAREDASEGTPMLDGIRSEDGRAVLLPATSAVWAALHRAALVPLDVARPRGAGGPIGTPIDDPFASAAAPETDALAADDAGGTFDAVLAVVDHGDLGAACVVVTLTRLDGRPVPVRRIELPSLSEISLEVGEGSVVIDRSCPARGLFVYAIPAALRGPYSIRLRSLDAPEGAAPTPSAWDGGAMLSPAVARIEPLCASGVSGACMRLASLALRGLAGPLAPRAALDRACEAGAAEACGRAAAMESDTAHAAELAERACTLGDALACVRHAHSLVATRAHAAALAYQRACDLGSLVGCQASAEMTRVGVSTLPATGLAVRAPFEPVLLASHAGTVTTAAAAPPGVTVGAACTLTQTREVDWHPEIAHPLDCRWAVRCGGVELYGGGSAGGAPCHDPNGSASTWVHDVGTTTENGDPAFTFEGWTAHARDDATGPLGAFNVTIAVDGG